MTALSFSPLALADLLEIADYIAKDNPARALSFVDALEGKCAMLARTPAIGTARPELGADMAMLPYRRHIIFYRAAATGVRIERVMHSARNIAGDDFGGS